MIFTSRQVEFIFAQFSPAVCLPCKQTDFTKRIIALFKVLLYRVSSKKLLKIENTRSNQFELEFSFSFDLYITLKHLFYKLFLELLILLRLRYLQIFFYQLFLIGQAILKIGQPLFCLFLKLNKII